MKTTFKTRMDNILNLYSPVPTTSSCFNQHNFANNLTSYQNTLSSSIDSSIPASTRTDLTRSAFSTYQRNISDFKDSLNRSRNEEKRRLLTDNSFVQVKSSFSQRSPSNKKVHKKITSFTDTHLINSKPVYAFNSMPMKTQSSLSKMISQRNQQKEEVKSKNKGKENHVINKKLAEEKLLMNYRLMNEFKPMRRYFIANLNLIEGNFNVNPKKNLFKGKGFDEKRKKIENKEVKQLSEYDCLKMKEKNEMKKFEDFSLQNNFVTPQRPNRSYRSMFKDF